jgi:hypothetical protein
MNGGRIMESVISHANEKAVWYSREDKIMSFHFIANYTKKVFKTSIDMFRFVLGMIDLGFRLT